MVELDDSYGPQIQDELPSSASVEDDLHKTLEQMKEDRCNNQA